MAVNFQIPSELEQTLRRSVDDLDAQAKEAFLVALYRQRKLSHLALSRILGLDRFETEELLHRHNVAEDLGSVQDYLDDAATLDKLRTSR